MSKIGESLLRGAHEALNFAESVNPDINVTYNSQANYEKNLKTNCNIF